MTLAIQTPAGPSPWTEAEKTELREALGAITAAEAATAAAGAASAAAAGAVGAHAQATDPHPGRYAAEGHTHAGLMTPAERDQLASLPTGDALAQQLAAKAALVGGKLDPSQLPDIAVIDYLGAVASQAEMLALVGQRGDWCSRTDTGTVYIITGANPAVIGGWTQLAYPAAAVQSVCGLVGVITVAQLGAALASLFATAAQGAKADSALQPGALPAGVTIQVEQVQDSGAAGREILRKGTMPEIQALVSAGGITNLEKLRLAVSLGRQDYIYSVPAVAPVMTFSAGDTPTVVSPKYIEYGDAAWTSSVRMVLGTGYPNSNVAFSQYLSDGAISAAPLNSSLNSSVFLTTDCPAPELRMKTFSGSFSVWYVEGGRRYFAGSVTSIPDNALHYLKIDFGGSRVLRTIEVEANQVGRWAIGANDSYYPAATNPLKVIIVGDSFTEGTGLSGVPMSYGWAPTFAKLCGIQLAQISALGGTGYSATNGSRVNLLQRLQSDVIDFAPDVVVHANGINDTLEGVTTNAPLVFDAISTALQNCQQVVFPAFRPRSITTVDPINELLSSLCATRDKALYVPCPNEIWGTGYGGNGTGNSSWVIGGTDGTDPTHPTNAGHRYLGRARRDFLAAALGL